MKKLPAHITWPLIIICFLTLGVLWGIGVVIASQIDGGPVIVDDYYDKAINWDERAALQARSAAMNWTVDVVLSISETSEQPPALRIQVQDADGIPVQGLSGRLTASRPHQSSPLADKELESDPVNPGLYHTGFPEVRTGLWDFELSLKKDTTHFVTSIRKEF